MTGDQIANLAYLGLLGAVIAGYFFASHRQNLGRSLRQLMLWALIFVGVIAAYGLWTDIRQDVAPTQAYLDDGRIEVPLGPDGHYHLTAEVNGTPVKFIVDTGASDIVLSAADAERAGVDLAGLTYWGQAQTANGVVRTAPVQLDSVRLGPVSDTGVRAVVNEGAFDYSLLGMSYLARFARIEIADNRLVLTR
ncbi:retropepsin-like aspartic protease family protein [Wenxinia saemankumensis]|uniref:Aspartyl protease family protein n=1 Tax=Wenxinia saemankumensis TaxID=1447782 RepID=A0A1M6HGY9_9RHOB|nr:TIGR02281 family clan AA aspartic protease [Wenxinia saemankumensis]SHJ21463.1 aspartyl protease family protein [Wenxinia saemankumensis]